MEFHQDRYLLQIQRTAMACLWEVLLRQGESSTAPEVAVEALDFVSRLEDELSIFKPTSELSRLNRCEPGKVFEVSPQLYEMLQIALQVYQDTRGAFDITAAKLTDAWGFSRRNGRKPKPEEIFQALQCVGSCYLELNAERRSVVRRRQGLALNPGGIGKGFALDRAAQWLLDAGVGNFLIHGGKSSVRAAGHRRPDQAEGWQIAMRNPQNQEQVLGIFHLRNQSLGTSGHAHQYFHYQGERFGHIIDPRSGWPVQGVESVTVVAGKAALADAYATGIYVMGPQCWDEFAKNNPDIGFLALLPSRRAGIVEVKTWNLGPCTWRPV
ncbi:MAG: Thiamine biosynthesis lipoprotein ApbE precursor [Planctomycetota bacterium]|jgi:thiamine biosynthesis lipoprotein